jgi:hypothetical protein
VARFRLAPALVVLALSSPAWAEGPSAKIRWNVGETTTELPASLRLAASASFKTDAALAPRAATKTSSGCNANGCGYKALLGVLYITRDIQASENVSVRVLPTSHAIGGEDAPTPILLRAETNDGYYGVRLRARF